MLVFFTLYIKFLFFLFKKNLMCVYKYNIEIYEKLYYMYIKYKSYFSIHFNTESVSDMSHNSPLIVSIRDSKG